MSINTAELLIEILCADLPARMQKKAAQNFGDLIIKGLDDADISYDTADVHSTPRRLIFRATNIPTQIADKHEERRGPRVDAPEQALQGFMKGNGLTTLDGCEQRDTGKGTFWFVNIIHKGGETANKLNDIVNEALHGLKWQKSMRWGENAFKWARPLRGVMAIFDGKTVDGAFDLGTVIDGDDSIKLSYTNTTVGHRFLAPDTLTVTNFDDYQTQLNSAYVMIAREDRKKIIFEEASLVAKSKNLVIEPDDYLLEEIVGLVEWPVILCGAFDKEFLDVPQECLIKTMKSDQKYIPLFDKNGTLSNNFIITANIVTLDKGAKIIAGNEKVLRARLSDAVFFYQQDLKTKLEDRIDSLKNIRFHEKLGSVYERSNRLSKLSGFIAEGLFDKDVAGNAEKAGTLCKADLVSGMVGEFASLQGIMGRYYAIAEGLDTSIAYAIEDHYKPAGPDDDCPTKPTSIALALAEKIDVLTGFFAIDEKPTGSKDPFALRRAALGIIRLILDNDLNYDLKSAFDRSYDLYGDIVKDSQNPSDALIDFIGERLKVVLKDKNVRYDLIDSVFGIKSDVKDSNLSRILSRVKALESFLKTDDGINLLSGYKRATNIVSIEEKKDKVRFDGTVNDTLLSQHEEKTLFSELQKTKDAITPALDAENYADVMTEMAKLRAPIDAFFDTVTVNDDQTDIRLNRLNILAQIRQTLGLVADFSKIEG